MPDSAGFDHWVSAVVDPVWGREQSQLQLAWLRDAYELFGPVDLEHLHHLSTAAQVEAVRAAVVLLAADTARTLPSPLELDVTVADGRVYLLCEGSRDPDSMGGVWGLTLADVLEECAASVQSHLAFDWQMSWPECPDHDRPLEPHESNGDVAWYCARHDHVVARIGELGLS